MTSNPPIPVRAFAGVLLIVQVFAVNAADLSRPTILSQAYDFEVVISNTVTLCVTAAGTEPLAYQWRKGATALPGQTNRCLVITNAQLAHEGGYRVVVRNSFGAVTSAVATVTVVIPPKITQQ